METLHNSITDERLEELRKIKRSNKLNIKDFPYYELTIKVYKQGMIDMGNGTKEGFSWFQNPGAEVSVNDDVIGGITTVMGVGHMVLKYAGIEETFVIAADEMWQQIADVIDFKIPEETSNKNVLETANYDCIESEIDNCLDEEDIIDLKRMDEARQRDLEELGLVSPADISIEENTKEYENEIIEYDHLFEPDWECKSTMFGGFIKDIPGPHVYYWPHELARKREIKARLMCYYGQGNNHVHVSFRQEDNPIWDGRPDSMDPQRPRGWTVTWDDKFPGKGSTGDDYWDKLDTDPNTEFPWTFKFRMDARRALEKLVAEYFPDHDLEWEDFTNEESEMYYVGKHGE